MSESNDSHGPWRYFWRREPLDKPAPLEPSSLPQSGMTTLFEILLTLLAVMVVLSFLILALISILRSRRFGKVGLDRKMLMVFSPVIIFVLMSVIVMTATHKPTKKYHQVVQMLNTTDYENRLAQTTENMVTMIVKIQEFLTERRKYNNYLEKASENIVDAETSKKALLKKPPKLDLTCEQVDRLVVSRYRYIYKTCKKDSYFDDVFVNYTKCLAHNFPHISLADYSICSVPSFHNDWMSCFCTVARNGIPLRRSFCIAKHECEKFPLETGALAHEGKPKKIKGKLCRKTINNLDKLYMEVDEDITGQYIVENLGTTFKGNAFDPSSPCRNYHLDVEFTTGLVDWENFLGEEKIEEISYNEQKKRETSTDSFSKAANKMVVWMSKLKCCLHVFIMISSVLYLITPKSPKKWVMEGYRKTLQTLIMTAGMYNLALYWFSNLDTRGEKELHVRWWFALPPLSAFSVLLVAKANIDDLVLAMFKTMLVQSVVDLIVHVISLHAVYSSEIHFTMSAYMFFVVIGGFFELTHVAKHFRVVRSMKSIRVDRMRRKCEKSSMGAEIQYQETEELDWKINGDYYRTNCKQSENFGDQHMDVVGINCQKCPFQDLNCYFISIECNEKCAINYHQACWRKVLEDCGITVEKSVLGKSCFTSDCWGEINRITWFDNLGNEIRKISNIICDEKTKKGTRSRNTKKESISKKESLKRKKNVHSRNRLVSVSTDESTVPTLTTKGALPLVVDETLFNNPENIIIIKKSKSPTINEHDTKISKKEKQSSNKKRTTMSLKEFQSKVKTRNKYSVLDKIENEEKPPKPASQDINESLTLETIVNIIQKEIDYISQAKAKELLKAVNQERALSQLTLEEIIAIVKKDIEKQQLAIEKDLDEICKTPTEVASFVECIICTEPLHSKRVEVLSPCSHSYHHSCIKRWLKEKSDCPQCRAHILLQDEFPTL